MPYTQNQIRCLSSMGIVPWIERSNVLPEADVLAGAEGGSSFDVDALQKSVVHAEAQIDAPTAQPGVQAAPDDFMQTPLVEIPFRGQYCSQLGKADAPLLILVEAVSSQQKQYPFEPTDAKLFDDMLRSIAWRRQDVCLAVLPSSQQTDLVPVEGGPCVADLCKPHRDAVLLFRHSMPETLNTDELLVPMERASMLAWQLPHPALLQESPLRKRQAWNVLKAARARLR